MGPGLRSARRRLLTQMRVEVGARTSSSSLGWMALQMEGRMGTCEAGPLGSGTSSSRRDISSSGTSMRRSMRLGRSEEHTSELQSRQYLVCRLLLEKKYFWSCVMFESV